MNDEMKILERMLFSQARIEVNHTAKSMIKSLNIAAPLLCYLPFFFFRCHSFTCCRVYVGCTNFFYFIFLLLPLLATFHSLQPVLGVLLLYTEGDTCFTASRSHTQKAQVMLLLLLLFLLLLLLLLLINTKKVIHTFFRELPFILKQRKKKKKTQQTDQSRERLLWDSLSQHCDRSWVN